MWRVWHACVCACVRVCYVITVYLSNSSCLIKGKVLVQYLKWQCSRNCPDSRSHNYTAGYTGPPNQHTAMPPTSPHTGQFDAHKINVNCWCKRTRLSSPPPSPPSMWFKVLNSLLYCFLKCPVPESYTRFSFNVFSSSDFNLQCCTQGF